jgi:hypothetical protein
MAHARIDYRDISTGLPIPGAPTTKLHPGPHGESVNQQAPPTLASGTEIFLFWNPPGGPVTTDKSITMTLFPGSEATAWYGRKGPGEIVTQSFSDAENKLLPQTPIASVVPATAWSGGNSENVSNSTSVTITAKDSIAGDSGETFDGWVQFEDGVVSGASLTVPAGGTCYAIASYRNRKVQKPYPSKSGLGKPDTTGLAYVTLLVGIAGDGGGLEQDANGRIKRLRPDPEPWAMAPADQDLLLGLSLNEIGSLVNDTVASSAIKKLGVELAQNALTRLNAEEPRK